MKIAFVLVSLLIIASLNASAVITDGLMVFFTFDKANGDQIQDMSGGNHNGTISKGAKIVTDIKKNGSGALSIDGGDQTMEVKTFKQLEEYQDNTYAFWIYFPVKPSGGWDQILAKPAPGGDRAPGLWATAQATLAIHWRFNPGNLGFQALCVGGDGKTAFDVGKWYHVAGVKKGTDLIGYVNGKDAGKVTVPAKIDQGVYSLFVGKSPAYGGPAAKFIIDDLAAYNRALTAAEVGMTMDGTLGTTAVKEDGKIASTWGDIKR